MTSPYYIELAPDGLNVVHRGTGETVGAGLEWQAARDLIWQKYAESLEFSAAMDRLYRTETTRAVIQCQRLKTVSEPRQSPYKAILAVLVLIVVVAVVFANAAMYTGVGR